MSLTSVMYYKDPIVNVVDIYYVLWGHWYLLCTTSTLW